MKSTLLGCLAFVVCLQGAGAQSAISPSAADQGLRTPDAFASIRDRNARAAALFSEAGKVIQHPRCVNCHPRTDRPLQGDAIQPHQPLAVRGKDDRGAAAMNCSTCHGASNYVASASVTVPGNPAWHLAPIEMAWEGKSLRQICQQIKDPKRNGNRTMMQIVDHMAHDSLVGWGWDPGGSRTPAPGTQQQLGDLMKAWVDAGAACPA